MSVLVVMPMLSVFCCLIMNFFWLVSTHSDPDVLMHWESEHKPVWSKVRLTLNLPCNFSLLKLNFHAGVSEGVLYTMWRASFCSSVGLKIVAVLGVLPQRWAEFCRDLHDYSIQWTDLCRITSQVLHCCQKDRHTWGFSSRWQYLLLSLQRRPLLTSFSDIAYLNAVPCSHPCHLFLL